MAKLTQKFDSKGIYEDGFITEYDKEGNVTDVVDVLKEFGIFQGKEVSFSVSLVEKRTSDE